MKARAAANCAPTVPDARIPERVRGMALLVLASLLPALHRYLGAYGAGPAGIGASEGLRDPLHLFAVAFLLLGVVPLAVVLVVFRESPRAYGLRLGDARSGLAAVGILAPVIGLVLLYPASMTGEMRAVYPFDARARESTSALLQLEAARAMLFYPAWEFFFRGFLLFGLRRVVGDGMAVCIQTIPSTLWHIGLPAGEVFGAIAGGIAFGLLALRTRSILWPLLLHLLIGVGLDLMIVLSRSGGLP